MTLASMSVIELIEAVLKEQSPQMELAPNISKKITLSTNLYNEYVKIFEDIPDGIAFNGRIFLHKGILVEEIKTDEKYISISLK